MLWVSAMGKDLHGNEIGNGIHQLKNGTYEARYYERNGKRVSLYDRNLDKLKRRLNIEKKRVSEATPLTSGRRMKLDEWFDKWLNVYKHNMISPSTKRIYIQTYENLMSPELGNMALQEISPIHVRELINKLFDNGYSHSTINKVKVLLVDMLDKALLDDLVWKNVARGIKLPKSEEMERRVLTRDEQLSFLETAKGTYYYNLYIVALNTGMRVGEVAALTPGDID